MRARPSLLLSSEPVSYTHLDVYKRQAYYLTHYKTTPRFKTKELQALNVEAAQPKFSNPAVAVMNAAGSKYLSPAGGGDKQITVLGEKLIDALPDREKVNSLRAKRRRKATKKKSARV